MTTTPGAARPDVSDMIVVHQALRDSLGAAPELVRGVDAADTARRVMVTNVYDNILAFLHVHHEGEELLVFPRLRDRCPGQAEMLDQMEAQHADVVGLIEDSGSALSAWSGGTAGGQEQSAAALAELAGQLEQHLGEEERLVLPLCADSLSIEEWGALPGHAMGNFTGDKVWLILGLIRERMSQAQRDQMIAHMPPPAVDMWTSMGEQAFKNLVAEVGPPLG
ncbi:MAG TPA: hemerythrin domain-containing protein [Acidimicrobiales bacterium]|nr:hemerythrin domain-containing protein [Acidimicrobiales bacterium]